MFDAFAEQCLRQLPDLEGTDWQESRRELSRIYLALIQLKIDRRSLEETQNAAMRAASYVRRLANVMEQFLFDLGEESAEDERSRGRAYAFLAAEAVDLWCGFAEAYLAQEGEERGQSLAYARIESALLYLASDYQIDAYCAVNRLPEAPFLALSGDGEQEVGWVRHLQEALTALCKGRPTECPGQLAHLPSELPLLPAARSAVIADLSGAVGEYCLWLRGAREEESAVPAIDHLLELMGDHTGLGVGGQFADLSHLARLLKHAVLASRELALYHILPRPQVHDSFTRQAYDQYLQARVTTRPFVWASARDYLSTALPGPHADGVVVIPTGSGKSFIAEIACSQAMLSGWVLYLAPTNALVHQVQRDLTSAFRRFEGVRVLSFIGGEEYTTLSGERLGDTPETMAVAVMTPEKCAMALRLSPSAFASCSLCIADEFHLVNDGHRGITLDLCLARVVGLAPNARLLLMSAMVANGGDVTNWVASLRGTTGTQLVDSSWRPCRTMRSLAIVDRPC